MIVHSEKSYKLLTEAGVTAYLEPVNFLIPVLENLLVLLPVLITVAFVTIAERKTMASMQRRLGPNVVGFYGSLQAFADALKLLLKEYVSPAQANPILFFLGPIITLVFALFGYLVIPFASGLVLGDLDLGLFYLLAVSSLSTYGILLAGWSANSKYAFLGSIRSTAQLVSYELVLSSGILVVIMLTASLNITTIIESQKEIWFVVPLFPLFLILFIGSVAETNRAPFDLAEAESELVSGFMTEHAAVIFVFFFLAEYASIVLICILNTILFFGGYLPLNLDFTSSIYFSSLIGFCVEYIDDLLYLFRLDYVLGYHPNGFVYYEEGTILAEALSGFNMWETKEFSESKETLFKAILPALIFGSKTCLLIFVFIWVRASFPRVRYDQLMSFCWTIILPLIISFIIFVPCILYSFEIVPYNANL